MSLQRGLSALLRAILRMPRFALRRLAGPEERNDRGDLLDLETQVTARLPDLLRFPKAYEQTPSDARASFERQMRIADPSPPAVARTEDRACEGPNGPVPLRVYWPRESSEPLPVLVYYHGGGYVLGSLRSYDGVCRRLARDVGCVLVAVDYRLAPEHPFPAAVDDGVASFEWAVENAEDLGGDPSRVAVGGDSAGGGLAAAVCHHQRDSGGRRPAFQLLIYPATDQTRSMESHRRFAHGYLLDRPLKDWFASNYVSRPEQQRDPRASPLFAERFDDLPPALVASAGFDPLRDEDEAYAERLREAGVTVEELREPSLVHGFLSLPLLAEPAAAAERIARSVRAALHGPKAVTAPREARGGDVTRE